MSLPDDLLDAPAPVQEAARWLERFKTRRLMTSAVSLGGDAVRRLTAELEVETADERRRRAAAQLRSRT